MYEEEDADLSFLWIKEQEVLNDFYKEGF